MLASVGFGVLWYTVGRGPAVLVVAAALAAAVVTCLVLARGLDRRLGATEVPG
jgi:hypothetical protein